MMPRPIVYFMIGIPGSGKSTLAQTLDGIVVSSDEIRKEYFGSADPSRCDAGLLDKWVEQYPEAKTMSVNSFVFKVMNERTCKLLQEGNNVVYDATNTTVSYRKETVQKLRSKATVIACYMDTPLNVCLRRNRMRERVVPDQVLYRMARYLKVPSKEEGFDEIRVFKPEDKLQTRREFNGKPQKHI